MAGVSQTLVAASFCWFLASSLWIYPHSLSYFNESIVGPLNGPKHLVGSSVDWGQDLLYLRKCWLMQNKTGDIPFLGGYLTQKNAGAEPFYFGGNQSSVVELAHARPITIEFFSEHLLHDCGHPLVVSVNTLQCKPWHAKDSGLPNRRPPEGSILNENGSRQAIGYSLRGLH